MREVTIFENFNKVKEHLPLEEMLNRIKACIYGYLIRPLRRLLKEGNFKGYDSAKRALPAFTPSARFVGGRKMQYLVDYTSVIVLDLDKLSEEELNRTRGVICRCEYTLACFVSPSGNGLKVLVCVSTGAEKHRVAFLGVQQHYMTLTGVEIDPSGKDITRLCFVSMDPELYYNPMATVFVPTMGEGSAWPVAQPVVPVLRGGQVPTWATQQPLPPPGVEEITDPYQRCIAQVERHCSFVDGHRNEFVFALALQLRRAGLAQDSTLMLMLRDYNFDEREVRNCVKSAYNYLWQDEPAEKRVPKARAKRLNPTPDAVLSPMEEMIEADGKPSKKKMREQYDLEVVEKLLRRWYETRYNEVTGLLEWRDKGSMEPFNRLEDYDENTMFCRLHHQRETIPINVLHILLMSKFSCSFNPFLEYFKQLSPWDGVTDFIGQLCDTVKTTDDDYWSFCFRKWFVAYAASLVEDDIINHTVIVFIGIQGVGKTSWMKTLVPKAFKRYLGTAALQADSKDTAIMLSECALIILDEMESLNRKDLASFKELITRPEIRIRRPYGRNAENLPRRASFIASVNYEQVLTDPSGSRRYLCSKVNAIDYRHQVDIDGAMAQAYALYRDGFKFWFDQEEIRELNSRNEAYVSKSIEEELIETWLRPVTRREWDTRNQFANGQNIQVMTATQIATKLVEKTRIQLLDNTIVKVGRIMKKLGFERIRRGNNFCYLVRFLDAVTVETGSRTLEDVEAEKAEQEANEQIIRFEEDLSNGNRDDGLPF